MREQLEETFGKLRGMTGIGIWVGLVGGGNGVKALPKKYVSTVKELDEVTFLCGIGEVECTPGFCAHFFSSLQSQLG